MVEIQCGMSEIATSQAEAVTMLTTIGPTLMVRIGFDPLYRPSTPTLPAPPPATPHTLYGALIDTGASASCIDSDLAAALNLPIVDRKPVSGVHGEHEVNMHLAQMYVEPLNYTIYGQFAGVHLQAGGIAHRAIIGRLFLQLFTMVYDGTRGSVVLRKT